MIDRQLGGALTALLIGFIAAGCAGSASVSSDEAPPDASYGSTDELEALYHARIDSARLRYTEDDVEFMTGMIAHHAQALIMAALAPTHGANEEIQTLAARIANAQKDEIATMQKWLRDRDLPVPEVHIDGTTLTVRTPGQHSGHEGMHGHHRMPGMLTDAQLKQLENARGPAFDRLFLEFMIQHHSGAVTMVHDLFASDGAAQGPSTFRLASDIQVDQITEIDRMKLMLEELLEKDEGP